MENDDYVLALFSAVRKLQTWRVVRANEAMVTPYYEHAGITIYHGDCSDVLPSLCAQGFDVAITDPQYGVGENYASGRDTVEDVSLALWALAYLRGTAKRVVLTCGIKYLFRYPEPTWIGSFSYPAGTGVNPWGLRAGNQFCFMVLTHSRVKDQDQIATCPTLAPKRTVIHAQNQ